MDYESWLKGYETGVMLRSHMPSGTPLNAPLLATMSVTGIAAVLEWFADLSGFLTLTLLRAEKLYSQNTGHTV